MRADSSAAVVYGYPVDPRKPAAAGGEGPGGMDLVITSVLKPHPALGERRTIRLSHSFRIDDPRNPPRLLVFLYLPKGKRHLDALQANLARPALVDYVKGVLAVGRKEQAKVLRYCFDYLDHPDEQVAGDAATEFHVATDRETAQVARRLPGARLRRWLSDPRLPPERVGLYAFLLGHCGGDLDGDFLRGVVEKVLKPWKETLVLLERTLSAYVLLRPEEGSAYLRRLLAPSHPFTVRFGAFLTVEFLDTSRPGVMRKKDVLAALGALLEQPDLADLSIEHLRRRHYWVLTDRILALAGKKSHDKPIIRRSILRYALQCPDPQARQFVAAARRRDAAYVTDTETLLKMESRQPAPQP
jgi:hypothetical protein